MPTKYKPGKIRQFWENCDPEFAHLGVRTSVGYKMFDRHVLSQVEFTGKRLVDYGCGGGHLGLHLLENAGLAHYTGVDIAQRSLTRARKRLRKYADKCEFIRVPIRLCNTGADIFVCVACMQHMCEHDYFGLLGNVNASGIPDVILQFRHGKRLKFTDSVVHACVSTPEDVASHLSNYTVKHVSPVLESIKYQYMALTRSI